MRGPVLASAVLLLATCAVAFAEDDVPPRLVDLIKGPSQVEIPCRIEFPKPELMFQQQYLLRIQGQFSYKQIEMGTVRHLLVLVKVQNGEGDWLDGEDYVDYKIPEHLQQSDLAYAALVYVRPGKYRVNVAIFDTETLKANVYHHDLTVPPLAKDPLPIIDELLPDAEFPARTAATRSYRAFWVLTDRMLPIRLRSSAPMRLDIVLNITDRFGWYSPYHGDLEKMLALGSVLERFRPANGCVRLSVVDVLRLAVVADRLPVEKLSWTKLQEDIEKINQDVIDVHVLANQKRIAQFTHDYLQSLATDKQGCAVENDAVPLVVVVSPDVVLPDGNKIGGMAPLPRESYVYLHLGIGGGWMDSMGEILSSGKAKKLRCLDPREFRGALAKITAMIGIPPK